MNEKKLPAETVLYLVIPCYNEQEVLAETSRRLLEKLGAMVSLGRISPESQILFVDDGSKDKTWELIQAQHREHPQICGLKLAHNKGHQNALLAGLMTAKEYADILISMDADLQDDVDAVDQFVEKYHQGCDIVYGVRSSRATDTVFKRTTAQGFYKVMQALGVDIVDNHADYRLMSRRAVEALAQYKEVNLFLRGIVPLIGFPTAIVTYERHERFAGESKYPLKKMIAFAVEGITSFSVKPLRMITWLGIVILICSFVMLLALLVQKLFGYTVQGWTTLMGSIWMIGGIQLFCLGLIGEYIGKIYGEVKQRPRFIVEEFLHEQP